jgi:hypothetical protein
MVERRGVTPPAGGGEQSDGRIAELVAATPVQRVFQRRGERPVIDRRAEENPVSVPDRSFELLHSLRFSNVGVERWKVDSS